MNREEVKTFRLNRKILLICVNKRMTYFGAKIQNIII